MISGVIAEVLAADAQDIYWLDPSDTPGGIYRVGKVGAPAGSATRLFLGAFWTDPLLAREGLDVSNNLVFWSEAPAQAIGFHKPVGQLSGHYVDDGVRSVSRFFTA